MYSYLPLPYSCTRSLTLWFGCFILFSLFTFYLILLFPILLDCFLFLYCFAVLVFAICQTLWSTLLLKGATHKEKLPCNAFLGLFGISLSELWKPKGQKTVTLKLKWRVLSSTFFSHFQSDYSCGGVLIDFCTQRHKLLPESFCTTRRMPWNANTFSQKWKKFPCHQRIVRRRHIPGRQDLDIERFILRGCCGQSRGGRF